MPLRTVPELGTPSLEVVPSRERSRHQTIALTVGSRNGPATNQSCAAVHWWRQAYKRSAGPCLRPIWEPRIQGCNDPGMYSRSDDRLDDGPDAHRRDDV